MKNLLKYFCFTLILIATATQTKAQVKIEGAATINQFYDLIKLDTTAACKFYTDKKYTLLLRQPVEQPTFTTVVYKYRLPGELSSFMLQAIGKSIVGTGCLTYNLDEFNSLMKTITTMGFKFDQNAGTKTVYIKGDYAVITEKKMAGEKPFYVLTLSDQHKMELLMKGGK